MGGGEFRSARMLVGSMTCMTTFFGGRSVTTHLPERKAVTQTMEP